MFCLLWKVELLHHPQSNSILIGHESDKVENEEDSSSSSDQMSTIDSTQEVGSESAKLLMESFQTDSLKLSEAKARKLKLMNSLIKILKVLDNGKMCIISSLVYIDKLSMAGDIICTEQLHS